MYHWFVDSFENKFPPKISYFCGKISQNKNKIGNVEIIKKPLLRLELHLKDN